MALWLIDGEEFVSEHAGAFSGDALEEPCEVLRVLEAEVVCNDADVIVGGSESPISFSNQYGRDVFSDIWHISYGGKCVKSIPMLREISKSSIFAD